MPPHMSETIIEIAFFSLRKKRLSTSEQHVGLGEQSLASQRTVDAMSLFGFVCENTSARN